jgi:uncharacterized membrane protein (DUF106 family)
MQAETSTVNPVIPVVLTIIGIIITVAIPVVSYVIKQIYNRFDSTHKRIDELKTDMTIKVTEVKTDAELKRVETRDTLLELVEAKFEAIKDTLRDIKDEVKGTNHKT